eukprot:CAMPEP_0172154118 /NCGR_PEP_ID=MMETSP1050-20130122/1851_1 /TAXON_ID=233186 /ORGANISM="Cryptomonas curvata, Strain CCAP979/52" /LENGTH=163 /DNA_ID=CAMNT_0012822787 /DNA_START=124 /DNA_END=611 /DNA_ORIENTATION=+
MDPGPSEQVGSKRPAENALPTAPMDVKHPRPNPDLPTVAAPTLPPMALSSTSASVVHAPTIGASGTVGAVAGNHTSPHLFPSTVQPHMPLPAAQSSLPPTSAPAPSSVSAVLNSGLPAPLPSTLHPILSPNPVAIPPMQSSLSLASAHPAQPLIHPPPPSVQP